MSADSSNTPGVISTPSTGTTSPVFTKRRSPGRTSSIGRTTSSPSFVSRDHLRGPVEERGELTAGAAIRVRLQRAPAREHQRDHGTGEVLVQRQRAAHGEQGDEIDTGLAPDQPGDRPPRERHQPDPRGHGPRHMRGVVRTGQPQDASDGDPDHRHPEPEVREVPGAPRLVAHGATRWSSASRCNAMGVSSVAMSVRYRITSPSTW